MAQQPSLPGKKYVPGEVIEPLSTVKFDLCLAYLRGVVRERYKEARRTFRAYQLLPLFEKHAEELIATVHSVYKGDPDDINRETVRALFTNPCFGENYVQVALAEKLIKLTGGLPKDELNTEGVDDVLKHYALDNPKCPPEVIQLAHQRPSAFDVMASDYKYRDEIMSLFRKKLRDNETFANKSTATLIEECTPAIMALKPRDSRR